MAKGKNHIHKYHRVQMAGQLVWACALPNCSHHTPKHYEANVPGKFTICWKCGEQAIMGSAQLKMDQPICELCLFGQTGTLADVLPKHDPNPISPINPSEILFEEKLRKSGLDPKEFRKNMLILNPNLGNSNSNDEISEAQRREASRDKTADDITIIEPEIKDDTTK